MPVVFDNVGFDTTVGTALQFNFTAAANTVLLVYTATPNSGGPSVSAIAYAGVALTRLSIVNTGESEVWALTAPASGSNVLSAQWVGATQNRAMMPITYLNVKAVGPFGNATLFTSGFVTAINFSISSTGTDLIAALVRVNSNDVVTMDGACTQRASVTSSSTCKLISIDRAGVDTTTSISGTLSVANFWHVVGIPLHFSAAAATSPFTLAQTGCGI